MRRSACNRLPAARRFHAPQGIVPSFIDTALVHPRAGLDDRAATRQMAEDMRQAGHREGGVSRDDLERLGWTDRQIDALAPAANRRAQELAGASL